MSLVSESDILRFASGEMDVQQENETLARCELSAELWRDVALAMVEHRRVVATLRDLVAESAPAANVLSGTPAMRGSELDSARPNWKILAALSAGLLVGAFAMRWSAGPASARLSNPKESVAQIALPKAQQKKEINRSSPRAVARENATPALDELAQLLMMEPMFREDETAVLKNHGFVVEESPALYVIQGKDGTRWAIPTNNAKLRYVNEER